MKNTKVLISLLFVMTILIACGTKETVEPNQSTQASDQSSNDVLTYSETKNNLKFIVNVNQKSFTLDDEIEVQGTVTNEGSETIEYYAGSSSCISHLKVQIVAQPTNRYLAVKPPKKVTGCTDDIHVEQLDPGETVTKEVIFLPKERIDSSLVSATSGTYHVVVHFNPVDENEEQSIKVQTSISIKGNDEIIISQEDAKKATNTDPKVQQWIKNHTGDQVSKVENGEYYLLWYDGWHKTNEEEYLLMRKGIFQEEMGIEFSENNWEITYLSKLGPAPHRIEITINGKTGDVLSVKTFEK
jgi:hypothetical protein